MGHLSDGQQRSRPAKVRLVAVLLSRSFACAKSASSSLHNSLPVSFDNVHPPNCLLCVMTAGPCNAEIVRVKSLVGLCMYSYESGARSV